MKIGLDLDDVVVGFVDGFLEFYNNKTRSNIKFNEWNTYYFEDMMGISKEEVRKLITEFINSDFYDRIKLINGAEKGIEKLSEEHELCFITSRPLRYEKRTMELLNKHNLKLPIFHSRSEEDVYIDKGELCKKLGMGLIIEDSRDYALNCAEQGIRVLLLDKPWNRDGELHKNIVRVRDWNQILRNLERK